MEDKITWVDFDVLENFMRDVFVQMDVPKEDAEIVADVLISADKRGIDSHGIGRFKPIYVDRIDDGTKTVIQTLNSERAVSYTHLTLPTKRIV